MVFKKKIKLPEPKAVTEEDMLPPKYEDVKDKEPEIKEKIVPVSFEELLSIQFNDVLKRLDEHEKKLDEIIELAK